MENVKFFFRNLLIIIAMVIPSILVIAVKALEWMTKRICACVRRIFRFFNANTVAMWRTEPAITVCIRGKSTAPVTSGNIESRRVKTTSQNMKNKKPYKEKKTIKTNEEAYNCRVSVPFNFTKQVKVETSKDNFNRKENIASRTTHSLWGQYSDVKNRKTNNYNQERNNLDRIKNPLKQQVVGKDLFCKTDGKSASSLNTATCTPRRLYCDVWNTNVSRELRNHHDQLNHILKVKPQEEVASSEKYPVRLWSVDLDAEGVAPESDHWPQDCCETNENNIPESATKELDEIMAQSSNSDISARSNKFSCNRILMVVSNAMVVFVTGAMQPICSKVNALLASIERNQRIKHCSSILVAVANAMVVFVLGSTKPVYSYVKAQLANIETRQRINQCSCMLITVANAMMSVVLDAMQSLCENRKVIKNVIFRLLWRAICVVYDLITSVVLALTSIVAAFIFRIHVAVTQLRAKRPRKRENISHEITCASPSNIRKDPKRNKAARIQDAHQAVLSTETVADPSCITNPTSVKTESTYPTSQQGLYCQFSDVLQNPTKKNDKHPVPQRTDVNLHAQTKKSQRRQQKSRSLKEKLQLNTSSTVGNAHLPGPGERQAKSSTKGKVKDKESSSVLPSNVDELARATVGKRKKPKKVATAADVDLPVTTASVVSKSNEKAMPRLIPHSYVSMVARAKANVQDIRSPRVGLSNLVMPAKVSEESAMSSPRKSDNKSSDEIQEVIKRAVSQTKRKNTESETTSTNEHALRSFSLQCGFSMAVPNTPTEVRQNLFELTNILNATASVARPRENIKRKADGNTGDSFKYEPSELDSRRPISQLATQTSHEVAVKQPELMEVGKSVDKPFSITWPEEMEVCQEPRATNSIFTAQAKPASASSNTESEIEEMETVEQKTSVWNFFSFSLPSFLAAPFKFQPFEEEMKVDEQTVPVAPTNSEEEEMETNVAPIGQQENLKWNALAAEMRISIAASTLSQQEAMEITQEQLQVNRPVACPFRELVDTKIPLASTVGMFEETALPEKVMPAEQHTMQLATQRQVMYPAVKSVMQPFANLWTQPVMKQTTQPAMQSVIQPVVQPAMQQVMQSEMPRQLVQRAAKPNAELKVQLPPKSIIDYSTILEYNSAVESTLTSEGSQGEPEVTEFTATGQTLTSEVTRQEATSKSRDQLIMEQLQLVPPTDPACYLADGSDSESQGDSDDEYELDLETIEKFSELESCPDHAQFITKLLIEKESTEWYNVPDSTSESNCDDKDELSECLDSEITGKYSELEGVLDSSPEHVERLAKLVAEKESSSRRCSM